MFLDYLIRLILLIGFIVGKDFINNKLKTEYDLHILQAEFVKDYPWTLQFHVIYQGVEFKELYWNFIERKLTLPEPNLGIYYTRLQNLLNLKGVRMILKMDGILVEMDFTNFYTGFLQVMGDKYFNGKLGFSYKMIDNKAIFTKTSGKGRVTILDYKIQSYDPLNLELQNNVLSIDGKKLYISVNLTPNFFLGKIFIASPILTGKANFSIGAKNSLDLKIEELDLISLSNNLNNTVKIEDQGLKLATCYVKGEIARIVMNNKKFIADVGIKAELDQKGFAYLHASGKVGNNKKLVIQTAKYKPILIEAEDAGMVMDLFSPGVLKGGELMGILNYKKRNWRMKLRNARLPSLSQIQVKHIVSPMRWIRLLFDDPSLFGQISCEGTFNQELDFLKIHSVSGVNRYYDFKLQGFINLQKDELEIEGTLSAIDLLHHISGKHSSLTDQIKFQMSGPIAKLKTSFQIAPVSVFNIILQPFMY